MILIGWHGGRGGGLTCRSRSILHGTLGALMYDGLTVQRLSCGSARRGHSADHVGITASRVKHI